MEEAAKFLFIGTAAVAFFTFLTVSHWISTRAAERRDRERMALLRKVAEQSAEKAALMRELLREEDLRVQGRERQRILRARRDGLQGGAILLAIGVGLAVFLAAVAPDEPVWTLSIMIILIGVIACAFSYFAPRDETVETRPDTKTSTPG